MRVRDTSSPIGCIDDDTLRRDDTESVQRLKSVLIDTRASQGLEPIRLPAALRGRIEKAQRRAAAAKDDAPSSSHQPHTAPTAEQATAQGHTGASRSNSRLDVDNSTAPLLREKIHLPDVVLGHKMRDFEAKTSANSLLLDPLNNSLSRLTIEEKERVMLRMQEKIQRITTDIDDSFVRIKDELDSNGIFDAAANYQRAQAICLVELQKRCKLERLRDEAIREVVDGVLNSNNAALDSKTHRISGKLNQLLTQSNQLGHESADRADDALQRATTSSSSVRTSTSRRSTPLTGKHITERGKTAQQHSVHLPKLGDERPRTRQNAAVVGESTVAMARRVAIAEPRVASRQRKRSETPTSRFETDRHRRPGTRQSERPSKGTTTHTLVRDDEVGSVGVGDRRIDTVSHHPHITQVLQQMAASSTAASSPVSRATATGSAVPSSLQSDTRPMTTIEQWTERSRAYTVIAARTADSLRDRMARQHWDSLGHFCDAVAPSVVAKTTISVSLLKRLSVSSCGGTVSSQNDSSCDGSAREDPTEKRKRLSEQYTAIQAQIQRRLERDRKRSFVSSAKVARSKTPSTSRSSVTTAVNGRSTLSPSMLMSVSGHPAGLVPVAAQATRRTSVLGASASAPVLPPHTASTRYEPAGAPTSALLPQTAGTPTAVPLSVLAHAHSTSQFIPNGARSMSLVRRSRDAGRNSLVERKLRSSELHTRRTSSLIGAPVPTDFSTIGHHSNARLVERRNAAQTWAWHHTAADGATSSGSIDRFDEHDDDNGGSDENDDTFGDALETKNDSDYDADAADDDRTREDDSDVDDASAVAYSVYDPETARSSRSTASTMLPPTSRRKRSQQLKTRNAKLTSRGSSSNLYRQHALGHSSGSMALHARLEEIWRALEFPFSRKLLMLEKYAECQDADTFERALKHWEHVAEVVVVRERMKAALTEFADHEDMKPPTRLTGAEWMFLRSLNIVTPSDGAYQAMSSQELAEWIRDNMDAVTIRCHKIAHELKVATGDDLEFQGCAYPPRM